MSRSTRKRVFILGAGCSTQYGYPLGVKLADELNDFLTKLAKIPGGCPIIGDAVSNSVGLAARFPQADTLDKLVNLFEERFKAFRAGRGRGWESEDTEQAKLKDGQILNAKIATVALFIDKEREAREKTLEGYRDYLLPSIFGEEKDWQSAVNNSVCSVLTFNYDRLFEIPFLDYFRDSQGCFAIDQFPFYGKSVLNSGFDPTVAWGRKRIEIEPGRYCFLKLHGSAGWWAKKCKTNLKDKWRDYCAKSPQVPTDLLQLEQFLAGNKQLDKWEPLIAFPHEKQLFTSDGRVDFVQSPYIVEVWRHAAAVLGEATEVTVVGYSFAEIDRKHLADNLLSETPKTTRIRIEDKKPEEVRRALEDIEVLENCLDFVERMF